MPSVHLRAVLYTLKGVAPAKNPYCSVALIWLYKVIKVAGLTEADEIGFIMDGATAAHIETTVFTRLVADAPCPVTVTTVPQPATALEGMMNKYLVLDYAQDYFMYCDIDILFTGSLRPILEKATPGTIHLHAEGILSHAAYGSDLPAEVSKEGLPGFSAGKFLITSHGLLEHVFRLVERLAIGRPTYWAVEQPFFNHAMLLLRPEFKDTELFAPLFYETMGAQEGRVFLDLNGETGDGACHLDLMVQGLLVLGL